MININQVRTRCSYFLAALCLVSCASLTQSQLKEVNAFGGLTKDFAAVPGKIFNTYNEAEVQKQLLLTNAIHGADTHLASLDQFYKNQKNKSMRNKQADAAMQVLNDYAQKLAHLAADVHSKQLDTAALAAGTDLDKLIANYNALVPAHQIPTGIGALFGQALSAAGDIYIRDKQAKAVKSFVTSGDGLVAAIAAAIWENFDDAGSNSLKSLIESEKADLAKNYLTFRKRDAEEIKIFPVNVKSQQVESAMSQSGQVDAWHSGSFDADRLYLQCLADLDTDEQLRQQFVAAADKMQKVHHQLLSDLRERRKIKDMYATLQDYAGSVNQLYATYTKIK
jgi:hypothetical protein